MRFPRFRGLGGRLSYANVMATLAFFFAISGVATAGVKYLTTSTPIPASSDLTGTYGNPLIGDGKITTAKFSPSAVAPNSSLLAGHPASDFARVIGNGTNHLEGDAHAFGCRYTLQIPVPDGTNEVTDIPIVTQGPNPFVQVLPSLLTVEGDTKTTLQLLVCNLTNEDMSWSINVHWTILRTT